MKSPDEIKKGLMCAIPRNCNGHKCSTCPNATYSMHELLEGKLIEDALTYITQLEERLAQAERERDAAVKDLGTEKSCYTCKHGDIYSSSGCEGNCRSCSNISCPCESCNYKWRGVCEENTKDDAGV